MVHRVSFKIGDEELILETGHMAKQANGAVFARMGGSAVLATACCGERELEDLDFVPLSVDYLEKYYAAGKIPGGFIKREGRPKDKEVLVSRLIDRPMRPLFSKLFKREIQVIPIAISTDQVNPPFCLHHRADSISGNQRQPTERITIQVDQIWVGNKEILPVTSQLILLVQFSSKVLSRFIVR